MDLVEHTPASELSDGELHDVLWRGGELSWLLDPHQTAAYQKYRAWEQQPPSESAGAFGRIYVLDWARRTGKSTLRLLTRFEDCYRRPGGTFRFASAFQNDIEEIVDDVSRYILDTCPPDLRPEYKTGSKGRSAGFYFPESAGSAVLLLVGLDKNPNGMRGRSCDGDDISESGYVSHLIFAVKNVLYPQYQGRPWARMCLESSAPVEPDTEYDTIMVEDAKVRKAYSFATIDDNPRLSEREREEFIRAAGGRGDPDCEREYFGKRGRSANVVVCPAFDPDIHVAARPIPKPEWALCYVVGDAGWHPDFFAWLWGWVDYERAKLVVKADWLARNAGTKELAEALAEGEAEHFQGIKHWDPGSEEIIQQWGPPPPPDDGVYRPEPFVGPRGIHRPYERILDGEPRLRSDLARDDGVSLRAANNVDPDAQFHHLNRDFTDMAIEIDPAATSVIAHTQAAHRGPNGKLARSDVHGHYDAMRTLAYFSVMANRHQDPKAPAHVLDPQLVTTPAMKRADVQRGASAAMNEIMKPRRWKPRGGKRKGLR